MKRAFGTIVVLGLLVTAVAALDGPAEAATSTDWEQVSSGRAHTCGLTEGGRVFCWGDNSSGQLGIGSTGGKKTQPKRVAGGVTDWSSVTAGGAHTCGTRENGDTYCWGSDSDGQLGNDGGGDSNVPVAVETPVAFDVLKAGGLHTCGLSDLVAYCWGSDVGGQVGDGDDDEADEHVPQALEAGAAIWANLDAGSGFTCAAQLDAELFCWGADGFGQLGDAAGQATQYSPVEVAGDATWSHAAGGDQMACALRTDSHLSCWGSNTSGELGNNTSGGNSDTPVEVFGGHADWTGPSAGANFACAMRSSGRLYCWGADFAGQLGNGAPKQDVSTPAEVAGQATSWESVDAGFAHACALKSSGKLLCWGRNDRGQLGIGDTKTKKEPVRIKPHP